MGWREFLQVKVTDPAVRQERIARIELWLEMHPKVEWAATPEVSAIDAELRSMIEAFGVKCTELRAAVSQAKDSGPA